MPYAKKTDVGGADNRTTVLSFTTVEFRIEN